MTHTNRTRMNILKLYSNIIIIILDIKIQIIVIVVMYASRIRHKEILQVIHWCIFKYFN